MTDQQKMITICDARPSQSGKTLGIKDQSGQYYSTKSWELQGMVGQAIYANTSSKTFPDGKIITFINDYTQPDGHSAGPQSIQTVQPAHTLNEVNRDASIVAQALCKCLNHDTPKQVWGAYKSFYKHYMDEMLAHPEPSAHQPDRPDEEQLIQHAMNDMQQSENPAPAEFDDDIPL